ncbi:MAG TPA: MlaD family protein, partial [Acidimicrobiales bacterium]|nr:MlaD family protein [Acidimicrobiales bacterium]
MALALTVVLAVAGASTMIVGSAYHYYPGGTTVSAVFPTAGEGLLQGAEVDYRGVQVGRVQAINLAGGKAHLVLKLEHGFQVPTDAQASLRPKSLFGNEEVLLHLPRGDHGPFLATGQSLPAT